MKSSLLLAALTACCFSLYAQNNTPVTDSASLTPVEVIAVRASDRMPIARTNLDRKEIAKNNTGADLPFILNQVPNVQVSSDAGNGIGYTGIRIRGSDASRINMTINGIPYNDAESQGIFFVNLPDLAASAGSIQVQRGVGTSTNGAGSFGASINISTNELSKEKEISFQNTAGSYHSFRNALLFNSGLVGKHWIFNARASHIRSDGYIDRASTRMGSAYGSIAYTDSLNTLQLNVFTGREKTYQAWYGIDEKTLRAGNRRLNIAGTEKPGEPYENETDNYRQTHYQLFYTRKLNRQWKANMALFFTRGKGYYEQYKADESLSAYGLPNYISGNDTIASTDLVRRLWLDNDFFGATYSIQHNKGSRQVIIGGSSTRYNGRHFGEVVNTVRFVNLPQGYRWYNLDADKTDFSHFAKWTEPLGQRWLVFADMQVRAVRYRINGFRNNPNIRIDEQYVFANPKAGISYQVRNLKAYAYMGFAAKEPNRDDFEISAGQEVRPEKMVNWEAGLEQNKRAFSWGLNLFYMRYRDQLVLTGKINDVGAYTRTNIPNSYRAGIELTGSWMVNRWLSVAGNLSLSRNRISDFTEFIDDYDNGGQKSIQYNETDISFSPPVVAATNVNLYPIKNLELSLMGKYVGKQFLDNTSNKQRRLNDYYVQDVRLRYTGNSSKSLGWEAFIQVNNLFSRRFEPNGYTFSYIAGGQLNTENYYFPMAPLNMVMGLNIRL